MDGQSLTVRSALSHLGWQGFIQSILMSSKLNLLTEFSNSIFMKFGFKAYWCWTFSTSRPTFYNIQKLNLCSKTNINNIVCTPPPLFCWGGGGGSWTSHQIFKKGGLRGLPLWGGACNFTKKNKIWNI